MFRYNREKRLLASIMIFMVIFVVGCLVIMLQQNSQNEVVRIGVIDTPLEDSYVSKYDISYIQKVSTEPLVSNHGSTILSIIKQKNGAQIYYASMLDNNLEANISDVANSIYWCVKNNVDIINMSFATTEDNPLLREAIRYAISRDVIIVASCINDYGGNSYPAMYNGVISVSDGDCSKSTIVVNKKTYNVKLLNGNLIQSSGTSCAAAYVTNQISLELAGEREKYVTKIIQK